MNIADFIYIYIYIYIYKYIPCIICDDNDSN